MVSRATFLVDMAPPDCGADKLILSATASLLNWQSSTVAKRCR
jgi:hypothetical protein